MQALSPVTSDVEALERELADLKELDSRRVRLTRDIATLQPKVMLIDKMEIKATQLEAELQRSDELQARVSELQVPVSQCRPVCRSYRCKGHSGQEAVMCFCTA